MHRLVLVFAALLVVGSPAFAADKVELAPRPDLSVGRIIRQVGETKTKQTLAIGGMNIDTNAESFTATRDTVGETTPDGKTKVHGEFEYFIVNLQTPMGNIAFDSNNAKDPETGTPELQALNDLFRATANSKWIATVNGQQEIESIAFDGDPFAGIDSSLKSDVSPERFLKEYNTQLRRYPDAPVAVGDTWRRTEDMPLGSGQLLTFNRVFKYVGPKTDSGNTVDEIEVKAEAVVYSIAGDSPLPLTVDKSELTIASSEGQMTFDRRYRMVTRQTDKVQIGGMIGFGLKGQNQKFPGAVDLTIDIKNTAEQLSK